MVDEEYTNKIVTAIILAVLIFLTFLLIRDILVSIIGGIVLAFIFNPVYKFLYQKTKSKDLSAILICIFLVLIIVIPLWFLTPILVQQSIKIYFASQEMDYITPLQKIFPAFFSNQDFSNQIGNVIHSSITKLTNYLMNSLSGLISNFPTIALQFLVISFVFYFFLRDGDEFVAYVQSLMPFSKEIEKKIFTHTRELTSSIIYGQVVVGILQGVILSIGLFIFQVPNALLLSLVAILVSILPVLGPFLIWIPVMIYLLTTGNTFSAIGIAFFGIIASSIDNILRPLIVSRRTKLHSAVVLIGMVGGLFIFGVLGLIVGPLILAYLLIVLEIYRNKKVPGLITQEKS